MILLNQYSKFDFKDTYLFEMCFTYLYDIILIYLYKTTYYIICISRRKLSMEGQSKNIPEKISKNLYFFSLAALLPSMALKEEFVTKLERQKLGIIFLKILENNPQKVNCAGRRIPKSFKNHSFKTKELKINRGKNQQNLSSSEQFHEVSIFCSDIGGICKNKASWSNVKKPYYLPIIQQLNYYTNSFDNRLRRRDSNSQPLHHDYCLTINQDTDSSLQIRYLFSGQHSSSIWLGHHKMSSYYPSSHD